MGEIHFSVKKNPGAAKILSDKFATYCQHHSEFSQLRMSYHKSNQTVTVKTVNGADLPEETLEEAAMFALERLMETKDTYKGVTLLRCDENGRKLKENGKQNWEQQFHALQSAHESLKQTHAQTIEQKKQKEEEAKTLEGLLDASEQERKSLEARGTTPAIDASRAMILASMPQFYLPTSSIDAYLSLKETYNQLPSEKDYEDAKQLLSKKDEKPPAPKRLMTEAEQIKETYDSGQKKIQKLSSLMHNHIIPVRILQDDETSVIVFPFAEGENQFQEDLITVTTQYFGSPDEVNRCLLYECKDFSKGQWKDYRAHVREELGFSPNFDARIIRERQL